MAKPIVDGIERDLDGQARIVRLDLFSPDGQAFFTRLDLGAVPAIAVLDKSGQAHYKSGGGMPDATRVKEAVRALTQSQP